MKKINSKALASVFGFLLLVSIFINLFLVVQISKLENQEEIKEKDFKSSEIESSENVEYETLITSLEREIKELKDEKTKILSSSEFDGKVVIDKDKEKREELNKFLNEFVDVFIERDSNMEISRRRLLEPYLTLQTLNGIAPEEPKESKIIDDDTGEEIEDEDFKYEVEIESKIIYHDESSLDSDVINAFAFLTIGTTVDDHTYSERVALDIRIIIEHDELKVRNINYHVIN